MARTQKIWLGIGVGFIVLATAGLLARDWLGPRVAHTYINIFYKNSVNVAFRKSFDPLDAQLRKHGVIFKGTPSAEASCEVSGVDAWLMTNSCDIIQQSNSMPLSNEYIAQWQRTSPQLEQYLLDNGWQKTWDQKQDIRQLFSNRTSTKALSVNYERKQDETKCILSIAYTANYDPTVFFANRECHRAITLFGE